MGLAIRMATAVTPPEVAGVLVWWGIVLAAPAIVLRRWRRRHEIASFRRLRIRSRGQPEAKIDTEVAVSAGPGPRLKLSTLTPLCRYVDFRRRLELAVAELDQRLAQLPQDRWRIEPYPLTGERRNTLLVLGETGVFVVCCSGYPGQVQPAICHPFTAIRPRIWHRADADGEWTGAWLVGGDSVIEWLEHFGPEHGLGPADFERFDELSKPNWLRTAIPTPPSWPPLPAAVRPGWQQ